MTRKTHNGSCHFRMLTLETTPIHPKQQTQGNLEQVKNGTASRAPAVFILLRGEKLRKKTYFRLLTRACSLNAIPFCINWLGLMPFQKKINIHSGAFRPRTVCKPDRMETLEGNQWTVGSLLERNSCVCCWKGSSFVLLQMKLGYCVLFILDPR